MKITLDYEGSRVIQFPVSSFALSMIPNSYKGYSESEDRLWYSLSSNELLVSSWIRGLRRVDL